MLEPGQKLDLYVTALSDPADLSRGHADLCRVAHAIGIASAASMRGIRPTSLFAPGPPLQAACTTSCHRGALSYVALVVGPMSIAIREKSYHRVRDRHPIHRCRHAADR